LGRLPFPAAAISPEKAPAAGNGSRRAAEIFGGAVLFLGLYLATRHNYLLFHSLAEGFSIVVCGGIFMVAWNSRRFVENSYLLFLGVAYLFVAGLDALHTLAYHGMGVFPDFGANLATQLWISARYIESLSFLLAPLFLNRGLRINLVLGTFAAVTALLLLSIFYWRVFPDCFIEGLGLTPFKKVSEYLISLVLLASLIFLYRRRQDLEREIYLLLSWSITVTIASELTFTLYADPYGLANLTGHFLKIISFYLIYRALIVTGLMKPYNLLFRRLKLDQEVLQRERNFVSAVLNTAGALVIVLDSEGRVVRFNRACEKTTGYSFAEVKGRKFWDVVLIPEEKEGVRAVFNSLISGQFPNTYENFWRAKDGTLRLIAWSNTCLVSEDDSVEHIIGAGIDVTEQRQAEDALQDALEVNAALAELSEILHAPETGIEEMAAAVLDQARGLTGSRHGYVAEIDPVNGDVVSHTLTQMMGRECAIQPGQRRISFPKEPEGYGGLWGHALNTGQGFFDNSPGQHEASRGLPQGHVPLERFLSVPASSGGHLYGQIALANPGRDYTQRDLEVVKRLAELYAVALERRRAADKLAEQYHFLQTLIDDIPNPIFYKDTAGRYLGCNQAFAEHLNLPKEEVIGKTTFDVSPKHLAQEYWDRDLVLFRNLAPQIYESMRQYPDGSLRAAIFQKAPLFNRQGQLIGLVGAITDITDRKRTEERLKLALEELEAQAAHLAEANEELSQFANVVSHDLKAPLRAIRNYADFLREDLAESLDGEQKMYLDGLCSAVGQGEELVTDLLVFAQVGRPAELAEALDLEELLQEVLTSPDLKHEVEIVKPKEWPVIEVERALVYQILQNLVDNAVKFNNSARKRVELGWRRVDEEFIELFVRDNGLGIDPRYHDKIFNMFQRLHSRQEFEGSGMGLAIVKKAAAKLGGSVRLESNPGEGSTFFVRLPDRQNRG